MINISYLTADNVDNPPSMPRVCPVIHELSISNSHSIAEAMCLGSPI